MRIQSIQNQQMNASRINQNVSSNRNNNANTFKGAFLSADKIPDEFGVARQLDMINILRRAAENFGPKADIALEDSSGYFLVPVKNNSDVGTPYQIFFSRPFAQFKQSVNSFLKANNVRSLD